MTDERAASRLGGPRGLPLPLLRGPAPTRAASFWTTTVDHGGRLGCLCPAARARMGHRVRRVLSEPTLTGIVEMIGPLPQHRGAHGEDLYPTVHLDRGYDSAKTRDLLDILGFEGEIASRAPRPRSRPADGGRSSAPTPG